MIVGNGGIATEIVHELENVDVVWAVKDSSISSVFVDAGAGEFLQKKLNSSDESRDDKKPVKRMKYTVKNNSVDNSTHHLGAALGPDWHKGFSNKGDQSQLVIL